MDSITIAWLAVGVLFVGLMICVMVLFKQRKYKLEAKDKKLFIIPKKDGDLDIVLLPVVDGQASHTIKTLEGLDKKLRIIVKPDLGFNSQWPPGPRVNKLYQTPIKAYLHAEGDPSSWNPFKKVPSITQEVLNNLQDEAFSRGMLARGTELMEELSIKKPKKKLPKMAWMIIGGVIIFLIVLVFVMRQNPGGFKLF